ncbi:hypothetical protein D5S17_13195 [Pseudonocardiaceae bacterium YIM PH 21723]|nr:hypothetical protein D5S17_13195 [Pseudonocardiaceae bacterium YIM PH 21723]
MGLLGIGLLVAVLVVLAGVQANGRRLGRLERQLGRVEEKLDVLLGGSGVGSGPELRPEGDGRLQ